MLTDKSKNCIICEGEDVLLICKDHPGFIDGNRYDIYSCNTCGSQFILENKVTNSIYDNIYSSENTYGYERYYNYAQKVKHKKEPLEYLAMSESTYFPVYEYLKNKDSLSILEVGCGYGYLSYALHTKGFKVIGIDVSSNAIELAKRNFGAFFYKAEVGDITEITSEKFDLIIATELLEHIPHPDDFMMKCQSLLKSSGCILLTTPDKDYFPKDAIWQTDLPPVHVCWITRKGMILMAQKFGLKISFTDFSKYYPNNENKIVRYLLTRKRKKAKAKLSKDGNPIQDYRAKLTWRHKLIANLLHRTNLIRYFSNFLYNNFNGSDITLGIILTKND